MDKVYLSSKYSSTFVKKREMLARLNHWRTEKEFWSLLLAIMTLEQELYWEETESEYKDNIWMLEAKFNDWKETFLEQTSKMDLKISRRNLLDQVKVFFLETDMPFGKPFMLENK